MGFRPWWGPPGQMTVSPPMTLAGPVSDSARRPKRQDGDETPEHSGTGTLPDQWRSMSGLRLPLRVKANQINFADGCRRTSRKEVDMIDVRRTGECDPLEFEVIVREGQGETHQRVTMAQETCDRLTAGEHTPERYVEAALRLLLDREPKESILGRFDVPGN